MPIQLSAVADGVRRPAFRAIAGLGATQIIGWGTTFSSLPIFGSPIAHDLGMAREWAFAGITVTLLVGALVAPRIGRRIDRAGARTVMVVGSVVAALALAVMSQSWNLYSYLAGWVVLGLATPMMLMNAAMPGLVQVVGANARQAITSLMLLSGLTSTIFLPINAWLFAKVGWQHAYLIFAGVHLLICAPLHWFALKPPPPGAQAVTSARANRRAFPPEGVLLPEHHKRAFVLLAVWTCSEGLITWGLNLQIIDILKASGLTVVEAIGVWAFVGPCQSLARFAELMSGGRHSILTSMLGAAVFTSLSFVVLLPFGISVPTAVAFCIAMGVGHGLCHCAQHLATGPVRRA
ncbi:MAG: MFS transporter [Hyphomicrobiaceae bacterium]